MASVDVPVALLGYGTVGSAVNRLLNEQADDIERATGHRLRVVKALVRDLDKERELPARRRRAHDRRSPRSSTTRTIAIVAEVMGGVEPAGEHVLELLRARQARRHREQAARRPARGGALRRRLGRRRPASLRGERLRGDPGDQGAARVARRHERPPRARDRQRHDELHAHRDGGAARPTTRRSPRRRRAASPRPTRPTTSRAPTPPRRWRSSRRSPSTRASRSPTSTSVGIDKIDPLDVAAARELDMVIRLVGAARLLDGKVDVRVAPGARRPPPSARGGRGRVQRRHAAGRRDPRDHARRPGRGRRRDRLGGDRRHGERDRDDGNRLPAERPRLARAAAARAAARTARRSTSTSRSTTGPACSRASPTRSPSARCRSRACSSTRTATARRSTSSPTRRARARSTRRWRRSRRWTRSGATPLPFPVVSERGVAELGWA